AHRTGALAAGGGTGGRAAELPGPFVGGTALIARIAAKVHVRGEARGRPRINEGRGRDQFPGGGIQLVAAHKAGRIKGPRTAPTAPVGAMVMVAGAREVDAVVVIIPTQIIAGDAGPPPDNTTA